MDHCCSDCLEGKRGALLAQLDRNTTTELDYEQEHETTKTAGEQAVLAPTTRTNSHHEPQTPAAESIRRNCPIYGYESKEMTNSRLLARYLSRYDWYYYVPYSNIQWQRQQRDNNNLQLQGHHHHHHHQSSVSLDAAWAHWEHNVLPRCFLPSPQKNVDPNMNSNESSFTYERAPIGEHNRRRPTSLYPIWKTPRNAIKNLSVRLYFNTLLLLAIILSISGLFHLPMMAYFKWHYSPTGTMRNSAICVDTQWVQCNDCMNHVEYLGNKNHSSLYYYPSSYRQQQQGFDGYYFEQSNKDVYPSYRVNVEQSLVRINTCNFDDWYIPGVLSYVGSIVMILLFGIVFYGLQRKAEIVFGEEMQTASDYSIKISNPPPDAVDADEWKQFFSQFTTTAASNNQVRTVTIAINNAKLLRTLVKRKKVWHQLKTILLRYGCLLSNASDTNDDAVSYSMDILERVVRNAQTQHDSQATIWDKVFLWNNPDLLFKELQGLDHRVRKLVLEPSNSYKAVAVYATFETERAQRDILHALSQGKMNIWRNQPNTSRFQNNKLHVNENKQPTELQISMDDVCLVSDTMYVASECFDPDWRHHCNDWERHSIHVASSLSSHHVEKEEEKDVPTSQTLVASLLKFRGRHLLAIAPGPEPNNVRWMDLETTRLVRSIHFFASTFVFLCFLGASGYFISTLRDKEKEDGTTAYVALYITCTNILVPKICEWISRYEAHSTEGSRQLSLYIKMALFRWFNSAICLLIITRFVDTISDINMNSEQPNNSSSTTSHSLPSSVYPIIFAEMFTIPLIKLIDPVNTIRRHVLAPRCLSSSTNQSDLNCLFRGSKLELAERYTDASKVLFVALAYSQLLPEAFFLAALALIAHYWSGKFCYYRVWRPAADIGPRLARLSRNYFFSATLVVHIVMSAYFYSGYPFDNVCPKEEHDNDDRDNDEAYQYCNQDMFRSGIFPPLPKYQNETEGHAKWMSPSQEKLVSLYGWTSLVAVVGTVLIGIKERMLPYLRSVFESTYEPCGQDQGIPFSQAIHRHELSGYIPQVIDNAFVHPLLAYQKIIVANGGEGESDQSSKCGSASGSSDPTSQYTDKDAFQHLFGWKGASNATYTHYNLLRDAEKIVGSRALATDEPVFSIVKYWSLD